MNINVDILYIYVPLHIQVPSIVLPMEAVQVLGDPLPKYLDIYNTRIKPQISPPPPPR